MAVALILISNLAYAYTASNLSILQIQEDQFYNYDFLDEGFTTVEDFEWGFDGDSLSKSDGLVSWTVSTSGNSKVEIDTAQKYAGTRSGKWYYGNGLTEASFTCSPALSYEFFYRRNGTNLSVNRNGDATHRIDLGIFFDGKIKYWDTQWRDTGYSISDNTWYRLGIRNINWTDHTFDIYRNGVKITSGANMQAYGGSNGIMSFTNSGASSFWIDDIVIEASSSTDVTATATMLFYNNASTSKVKDEIYWETAGTPPQPPASTDYAPLNDGNGWIWDEDRGTKHIIWSGELASLVHVHLRVYAPDPPDYMENSAWGKYVIGTTHFDAFPFEEWFGFNEYAEDYLADYASDKGYTVFEDNLNFENFESRVELIIHPIYYLPAYYFWQSDGYATVVNVP